MSLFSNRVSRDGTGDVITTYVSNVTDNGDNTITVNKYVSNVLNSDIIAVGGGGGTGGSTTTLIEDSVANDNRLDVVGSAPSYQIKTSDTFRAELTGLQNQINSNATNISNIVAGAGASTDTLAEIISAYEGADTTITSQVANLDLRTTTIETSLGDIYTKSEVDSLITDTTTIESDITTLQNDTANNQFAISNLQTNTYTKTETDALIPDVTTINSSISDFETRITQNTNDIAGISIPDLTSLQTQIDDLDTNTYNKTEVDSLIPDLTTINTNINQLNTSISNYSTSITANTNAASTNSDDISSLQSDFSNFNTNFNTLSSTVSTNSSSIISNLTSITNQTLDISNLASRITTLEGGSSVPSEPSVLNENPIFSSNSSATLGGSAVSGYVVSAKTELLAGVGYNAWKAFNHGTGLYHNSTTDQSDEWIQIQYPDPILLYKYSLAPRDDGAQFTSLFPAEFDIQASNDGSAWTIIDTQSGINSPNFGEDVEFVISGNTTLYSYYRLLARYSTLNGNTSINTIAISEWRLYDNPDTTGGSTGGGSTVEPSNYIKSISHTSDSLTYTNQADLQTTMNFDNFLTEADSRIKSVTDTGTLLTFTNQDDINTNFDYSNFINATILTLTLNQYVHKTNDTHLVSLNDTGTRLSFTNHLGTVQNFDYSTFVLNSAMVTYLAPYLHKTNDTYLKSIALNASTNGLDITKGNDSVVSYSPDLTGYVNKSTDSYITNVTQDLNNGLNLTKSDGVVVSYTPTQNDFTDSLKAEVEKVDGIIYNLTLLENNLNDTPSKKPNGDLVIDQYVQSISYSDPVLTITNNDGSTQAINVSSSTGSSSTDELFAHAFLTYVDDGTANGSIQMTSQGSLFEFTNVTVGGTVTGDGGKNIHINFVYEYPDDTLYKVQFTPLNFTPSLVANEYIKIIDKTTTGFKLGYSGGRWSDGQMFSVFVFKNSEASSGTGVSTSQSSVDLTGIQTQITNNDTDIINLQNQIELNTRLKVNYINEGDVFQNIMKYIAHPPYSIGLDNSRTVLIQGFSTTNTTTQTIFRYGHITGSDNQNFMLLIDGNTSNFPLKLSVKGSQDFTSSLQVHNGDIYTIAASYSKSDLELRIIIRNETRGLSEVVETKSITNELATLISYNAAFDFTLGGNKTETSQNLKDATITSLKAYDIAISSLSDLLI